MRKLLVCAAVFLTACPPKPVPPPPPSVPPGLTYDADLTGTEYLRFDVPDGRVSTCAEACSSEANCAAFTFVKPGARGASASCSLKSGVTAVKTDACCVSAVKPFPTVPTLHVATQHNDMERTGAITTEPFLTPDNVRTRFSYLYERSVNGKIIAQPLYVSQVDMGEGRGKKNVVYVATNLNWVYAFDADSVDPDPSRGKLWERQLAQPGQLPPDRPWDMCDETRWEVGITSTPAIDTAHNAMFIVARQVFPCDANHSVDAPCNATNHCPAGSQCLSDGHCDHYYPVCDPAHPAKSSGYFLYKIDPRSSQDLHPPVEITGKYANPGWGPAEVFDPYSQLNRPGLLLMNGVVYAGFATRSCDAGPYHGWVIGYRTSDLSQTDAYCASPTFTSPPTAGAAGIWQSGNGLAGDSAGNIYVETGNGPTGTGDSFLRLHVNPDTGKVSLASQYTPRNAEVLKCGDTDMGSGGPVLLPGNRLIGGGKQGVLYVLDQTTLAPVQHEFQGSYDTYHLPADYKDPCYTSTDGLCFSEALYDNAGNSRQCNLDKGFYEYSEHLSPNIHGGPTFWQQANPAFGLIYLLAEKDYLRAYRYDLANNRVICEALEYDTDRPGGDYKGFDLTEAKPELCRDACSADTACAAFTYAAPGLADAAAHCQLKSAAVPGKPSHGRVSGTKSKQMEFNVDRPGSDYRDFALETPDPAQCRDACANEPGCAAYTYVRPGVQGAKAMCHLKSSAPPPTPNDCCTSGTDALVCNAWRISGAVRSPEGMPGGFLALSSLGPQNGILWALVPLHDGQWKDTDGVLIAVDALTLEEIWRDPTSQPFTKFVPPLVADGKLFRSTMGNKLIVYGLSEGRVEPSRPFPAELRATLRAQEIRGPNAPAPGHKGPQRSHHMVRPSVRYTPPGNPALGVPPMSAPAGVPTH